MEEGFGGGIWRRIYEGVEEKLVEEMKAGVVIYPPAKQIFNAFNLTPFDKVKVVILGQDPYHSRGQAHGLSFRAQRRYPSPSLVNIFKEIESDLAVKPPKTPVSGNLENWAKQGVLLLNAILTVRANSLARHSYAPAFAGGPPLIALWAGKANQRRH